MGTGIRQKILAIDLSASSGNETGIAFLHEGQIETATLHTDAEIVGFAERRGATLIGIDAPLSLPAGRKDIEVRDGNHFRECDLQLRKLGIRFFPVTLGGMRKLTKRGMELKRRLEDGAKKGAGRANPKRKPEVVEIFPGASFDMLGIPRKNVGETNEFLSSFGCKAKTVHESDAAIGAYTLLLYAQKKALALSGKDGCIIIPKPGKETRNGKRK